MIPFDEAAEHARRLETGHDESGRKRRRDELLSPEVRRESTERGEEASRAQAARGVGAGDSPRSSKRGASRSSVSYPSSTPLLA